jgi:hypothetical protein
LDFGFRISDFELWTFAFKAWHYQNLNQKSKIQNPKSEIEKVGFGKALAISEWGLRIAECIENQRLTKSEIRNLKSEIQRLV